MKVFLDANAFVYAARDEAPSSLLDAIARGDLDATTSTAVLEEVWHLELTARVPDLEGLTDRVYELLIPLLPTTDMDFAAALTLDAPHLGANDRLHAGVCIVNGIDTIVSADRAFDDVGQLQRVDPLDADAVTRLLAAA